MSKAGHKNAGVATPAQSFFATAFGAFLAERRGKEPAWLTQAREDAFARFAESGFPTRDTEQWRFTNLAPLLATPFANLLPARLMNAGQVTRGVTVTPLTAVLARDPESLRATWSIPLRAGQAFAALNAAFATNGIVIDVNEGVDVAEPFEIRHEAVAESPSVALPRLIVRVARDARLKLVETWTSKGPNATLTNRVTDVRVADGASLEHLTIVDEAATSFHVGAVNVTLGRNARYASTVVTMGGHLVREDRTVRLEGEGAECRLDGLYVASGNQQVDHHTIIEHAVPHTTSTELYKGLLDGKSRGVFSGLIVVAPGAQKTNAAQKNDNLLLSNDALAYSTPQLEIRADDVQCRHGSTIGQLEGDPLFYLRSRGISAAAARELLTFAFANEVLERVTLATLRERLVARLFGDAFGAATS